MYERILCPRTISDGNKDAPGMPKGCLRDDPEMPPAHLGMPQKMLFSLPRLVIDGPFDGLGMPQDALSWSLLCKSPSSCNLRRWPGCKKMVIASVVDRETSFDQQRCYQQHGKRRMPSLGRRKWQGGMPQKMPPGQGGMPQRCLRDVQEMSKGWEQRCPMS